MAPKWTLGRMPSRDDYKKMLSDDPWDFDRFMQYGLEKFIHWFVEDRRDLFDRGDL